MISVFWCRDRARTEHFVIHDVAAIRTERVSPARLVGLESSRCLGLGLRELRIIRKNLNAVQGLGIGFFFFRRCVRESLRRDADHPLGQDPGCTAIEAGGTTGHVREEGVVLGVDERGVDVPVEEAPPGRFDTAAPPVGRAYLLATCSLAFPECLCACLDRRAIEQGRGDVRDGDVLIGPPPAYRARSVQRKLEDAPAPGAGRKSSSSAQRPAP